METLSGPLTVGWDITHMCNLRCKHCYAAAGYRGDQEFSLEKIKSIVDELDHLGTILIALAGGEPLMRKDICEIISYIKAKKMEIFLNTNGTLITDEKLVQLMDAGLTHVEISIDGLEADHDFIRGEGSFRKALDAIAICQKRGVKVGVMSTLFKHNVKQIPEFIDYFHDLGVIGMGFLRFIETGRGAENRDLAISMLERKEAIETVYKKRIQYGENFYLKVETPLSYLIAEQYKDLMAKHKYISLAQRGCTGGIISCQIRSDGVVTLCPQMEKGHFSLHDHSMEYIWKNDPFFKLLRTREVQGKCGRCVNKNTCGGCRVASFLETGNIMGQDPGCWLEC